MTSLKDLTINSQIELNYKHSQIHVTIRIRPLNEREIEENES